MSEQLTDGFKENHYISIFFKAFCSFCTESGEDSVKGSQRPPVMEKDQAHCNSHCVNKQMGEIRNASQGAGMREEERSHFLTW